MSRGERNLVGCKQPRPPVLCYGGNHCGSLSIDELWTYDTCRTGHSNIGDPPIRETACIDKFRIHAIAYRTYCDANTPRYTCTVATRLECDCRVRCCCGNIVDSGEEKARRGWVERTSIRIVHVCLYSVNSVGRGAGYSSLRDSSNTFCQKDRVWKDGICDIGIRRKKYVMVCLQCNVECVEPCGVVNENSNSQLRPRIRQWAVENYTGRAGTVGGS